MASNFAWLLVCAALYYYYVHLTAHYSAVLFSAQLNKTQGEEIWTTSGCATKPAGFKSELLDCGKALHYRSLDPEFVAMEQTVIHLLEDDLSPWNWLNRCHYGICQGFIWHLSGQIIHNFQLVLVTLIVCGLVVLSFSSRIYYRCCMARREKLQADRATEDDPRRRSFQQFKEALQRTTSRNELPSVDDTQALREQFEHAVADCTAPPTGALPVNIDTAAWPSVPPRRGYATMPAHRTKQWMAFQECLMSGVKDKDA
jgi:hypothetical protein